MATHALDNQLPERLAEMVKRHERQIRELKTLQLIGGDVIEVEATNAALATVTLGAGLTEVLFITFTPSTQVLMNVDCYVSIYVDTDDNNHIWPNGASLTSAQKKVRRSLTPDWAFSNDATGERVFLFSLENYDTASHTYYVRITSYAPKNPTV